MIHIRKIGYCLAILLLLLFSQRIATAALPNQDAYGNKLPSLAPMLREVNPAVVNISTYSTNKSVDYYNPLLNDPFFRRFFDIPNQRNYRDNTPQKRQQSAGSGVIVDAENGVIMTNHHVIKDAEEVRVSLIDGRSFKASVLGSDPDLDIAILKIKAKNLAEVSLFDSNQLEVGDFVVAIGNPFGLGQTVTTGVVSALGRSNLGIEGFENFIQTDASINPGNSGGALVNLRGELVGINTAIISPAGGNVGIGFAIPINMAKSSMDQILEYGEVNRGQIGISIQEITPDLREAFEIENGQHGVLVANVGENTSAERAGVQSGDIIIAVNGVETRTTGHLRSMIGTKPVGEVVELTLIRDGNTKTLSVEIGEPLMQIVQSGELHRLLEGATFENNKTGKGVSVTQVAPNSPAAYSGLRTGDIVISANKQRVENIGSLQKALAKDKDKVLLRIQRNGRSLYLVIR